ncbi:MAG: MATE family efflux transporter [Clostridia bacterium]|nr:MATE family efflux transporter [Clostridia bacterium]
MIKDMTVGKPAKVLLAFSLPMLLSMAFQQLYNIADSVIAGKFAGSDALAAIGASYPVTMLFLAVALGAGVGSSVIVSQFFGVKKLGKMKTAIGTSVLSIMALAVVLTGVGLIICRPVIRLLQTPADIFSDANTYLYIYIAGLPFLFLYNAATSIFTGLGDSRTPLFFLIFSSVFNVALDIVFVTAVHWGVAGVAWATFIAQGLSGVLAMVTLLFRIRKIKCDEPHKIFEWAVLKKISLIALPSILQQSFISIGQLCVQGLINSFGKDTIAGYSAAIKINVFCVAIFNTMSNALSSYTAQNSGAGDYERVKKGYPAALAIIMGAAAVFILVLLLAGNFLIGLFVDGKENNATVIAVGRKFLYFVAAGYPIVAYKVVTDGLLRGSGFMSAFMISTFTDLIVRVGFSFLFAHWWGFTSVCISFPVGWLIGALVSMIFYLSGKWKYAIKV